MFSIASDLRAGWALTFLLFTVLPAICSAAESSAPEQRRFELEVPVDLIVFLDNDRLMLVANEARRIQLLNTLSGEVERDIGFETISEGATITDVAVADRASSVYLVGEIQNKDSFGFVSHVDIESDSFQTMRFRDSFRAPTVAASKDGQVYIGDLNSNTVTGIEAWMFEKFGFDAVDRSDLGRNIYLKQGAARDLAVTPDGRFIVASHDNLRGVSLIDTEFLEQVDLFDIGGSGGSTVRMRIGTADVATGKGIRPSLVVTDIADDIIWLLEIDPDFQNFELVMKTPLGLHAPSERSDNSAFLASADNKRTIIVGSRDQKRLVAFSLQDRALVGRYVAPIESSPHALEVSADGRIAAILHSNGRTLTIVENPLEWARLNADSKRSQRVAETQKLLAGLGYPVGVVDGKDGPDTRAAIMEFQKSAGIKATGKIDDATFESLTKVATEDTEQAVCNVLPENQRCPDTAKELPVRQLSTDRQFEEVICIADVDSDRRIQFDRMAAARAKTASQYACTVFHSCAFIRFTHTLAYIKYCR